MESTPALSAFYQNGMKNIKNLTSGEVFMFFDGMKVGYFRDLNFEKDIRDRVVSSPERVPLPLESDGAKSLSELFCFFQNR
jgi:hypothetical protein